MAKQMTEERSLSAGEVAGLGRQLSESEAEHSEYASRRLRSGRLLSDIEDTLEAAEESGVAGGDTEGGGVSGEAADTGSRQSP